MTYMKYANVSFDEGYSDEPAKYSGTLIGCGCCGGYEDINYERICEHIESLQLALKEAIEAKVYIVAHP